MEEVLREHADLGRAIDLGDARRRILLGDAVAIAILGRATAVRAVQAQDADLATRAGTLLAGHRQLVHDLEPDKLENDRPSPIEYVRRRAEATAGRPIVPAPDVRARDAHDRASCVDPGRRRS